MINKKMHGQFYTTANPFNNDLFYKWVDIVDDFKNKKILEPFAGSNNIVKMIADLGYKNKWSCYDIEPGIINNFSDFIVHKKNTLLDYPNNHIVVITNPPYLAKNSATRSGLSFPTTDYDDLYKYALDIMLKNTQYVAAIIPESFITQGIFHNRLFGVISLTCRMFEDTDCPVCLSLFIPEKIKSNLNLGNDDFFIYKENVFQGKFSDVQAKKIKAKFLNDWKFNVPDGEIGLFAIDNTRSKSIRFVLGDEINPYKIKISSRGITRIKGLPKDVNINIFIKEANKQIDNFRKNTNDLFLTAFRGLRKDGYYRRRLDFNSAREILSYTFEKYIEKYA
jgi:hypothetical protein